MKIRKRTRLLALLMPLSPKCGVLMTKSLGRATVVYGARAGAGGLGHSGAVAIAATAPGGQVFALGPGHDTPWSLPGGLLQVEWVLPPKFVPDWMARYSTLRWRRGDLDLLQNSMLGKWAAEQADRFKPQMATSRLK
jgi:hypothetical protein